jgi:hypothetical protein
VTGAVKKWLGCTLAQGFYMRVVPSRRNAHNAFRVEEAIAMSLRAATTFTIGFRVFYAFVPLASARFCAPIHGISPLFQAPMPVFPWQVPAFGPPSLGISPLFQAHVACLPRRSQLGLKNIFAVSTGSDLHA